MNLFLYLGVACALAAVGWIFNSNMILLLAAMLLIVGIMQYLTEKREAHLQQSGPGQLSDNELDDLAPKRRTSSADEATDILVKGNEDREDFVAHLARTEH